MHSLARPLACTLLRFAFMPRFVTLIASNKRAVAVRIAALLLLPALVAGCPSQSLRPGADDPAQVTNTINLSGFPPEYKRGFAAGCGNAKDASGRSGPRPKGDASFVQGWQDGLDYCRPRKPR
jgi:hypothetical protein